MNKGSVTAEANAVKKGVVVVRSSRVATGSVGWNVELEDDKLGFIAIQGGPGGIEIVSNFSYIDLDSGTVDGWQVLSLRLSQRPHAMVNTSRSSVWKERAVGLSIVNFDNMQHGANENVRVQTIWDGIETMAAILTMK